MLSVTLCGYALHTKSDNALRHFVLEQADMCLPKFSSIKSLLHSAHTRTIWKLPLMQQFAIVIDVYNGSAEFTVFLSPKFLSPKNGLSFTQTFSPGLTLLTQFSLLKKLRLVMTIRALLIFLYSLPHQVQPDPLSMFVWYTHLDLPHLVSLIYFHLTSLSL